MHKIEMLYFKITTQIPSNELIISFASEEKSWLLSFWPSTNCTQLRKYSCHAVILVGV